MKASPAAFSMISSDISINTRLRRARTPVRPSANSTAARRKACVVRVCGMVSALPGLAAEVIGACQRREQQHRGELHRKKILAKEVPSDASRSDRGGRCGARRSMRREKEVGELAGEDEREEPGPDPHRRR